MPIQLDDLSKQTDIVTYSAKFFDSKLTGAGKKIGLLSEYRNPAHVPAKQRTTAENIDCVRRRYTNGSTETSHIPLNILPAETWGANVQTLEMPDVTELYEVARMTNPNGMWPPTDTRVYAQLVPHSMILEETAAKYKGGAISRTLTTCYRIMLWFLSPSYASDVVNVGTRVSGYHMANKGEHYVVVDFTTNPRVWLTDNMAEVKRMGFDVDPHAYVDFVDSYDLYSGVIKLAEVWQTEIDKVLDHFFAQTVAHAHNGHGLNLVAKTLHNIENNNVPLDLYRNIYKSIVKHFTADEATTLCKQNLNLLLSDTLHNLDQRKAQLTCIPQQKQAPAIDPRFSHEQQMAITSSEPLILTQAGAGTGKSTVVLARIKYMVDSGIDPKDITVLSFTNAAADHITEKNPDVHSMTIARMIHSIYALNYPKHELSSIDTIINSIDIYFPKDNFAYEFRRRLIGVMKNDRDAFTRMNNFIERNFDSVMHVLDTIKQTSLELEIIICYQKIDVLSEPADVQSKYLIIDEVQDNSIFEFVYTLKYVDKHNESLFLVGDSSQTLYEFRASNPKALNVLEGSGVFATYQLQTNYRSNQEILDFANVALSDIEANQYAHIQLQANNLTPVTEQSFTDKVQLYYERMQRANDINNALGGILRVRCGKYISDKLAKHEQVAFLAYKRRDVYRIQEELAKQYPNASIVSLVPEKMYNSTVFSAFIKRYWTNIKFAPTKSAIATISSEIKHYLPYLVSNPQKAAPAVGQMLYAWANENRSTVAAWQAQLNNGTITHKQFMDNLRENMLLFEIRRNAVRQSMLSAKNEATKANNAAANADFVISTIHSAKGLEFPHTVILYHAQNNMDEEDKRMYYVAFTRAMRSEFIIAYDTVANPKIEGDYNAIIKALHTKAAAKAARKAKIVRGQVQLTPAPDEPNDDGND